jgi:hypothetical protein
LLLEPPQYTTQSPRAQALRQHQHCLHLPHPHIPYAESIAISEWVRGRDGLHKRLQIIPNDAYLVLIPQGLDHGL